MSASLQQRAGQTKHALHVLLRRLWHHLGRRRQWQFGLLLCLMLTSALAEVVSLGAVLPFIGVLAAPDRIFNYPVVASVARSLGIAAATDMLLPLTVAFAAAAMIAGGIRMLLLWSATRLAYASSADLSADAYRRTLYQPFRAHLARNSSELINSLTSKASIAAFVLNQVLTLISSTVVMAAITMALLAINTTVTLFAAVSFGSSYLIIAGLFRKRLQSNSSLIAKESTRLVKVLQEGVGSIRDMLLDGTQPIYSEIQRRTDRELKLAQGSSIFIGGSPRYAMEAVGTALIAVLAYSLTRQGGGIASTLPLLGALALGAQRLLPNLQQIYTCWSGVVGSQASLADILELLDQPLPEDAFTSPPPLQFQRSIRFDDVHFRYAKDGPWVLDGIDLAIPKGKRVGFVGGTGSGKSTALDLLMGLIDPDQGSVLVDGQPIRGEHRKSWQRTIAHVPQSIFLADTTLAENIAFGVPREAIDMERVRQAARQAQIADFVEAREEGYHTLVGERGVFLSGGQRQRIGIARALYKRATVLVFDEATSALDNATEQGVMKAIEGLDPGLTIILVAHRLSTVRGCDFIVEFGDGRIVAQGTYDSLLESSPSFRNMALMA
jgi:ATP-binding cassette, subfamily B, bacterial PglK